MARKSFKKTYKKYFIIKQKIKFLLKKAIFWKWDFSEVDYFQIKSIKSKNKYYYFILNLYCIKDFLKIIIKLPLIVIFSTLSIFYSSAKLVYIHV
jgi:hypothetical protein